MRAEDPLPLRTAKITQGAALKRSEKAAKKAAAAADGRGCEWYLVLRLFL